MEQVAISVVVPHFSDLKRLDICLDRLERQTLPSHLYEVIVADNASPEGAAAVRQAIAGRARLITVLERGAGAARNGGVAVANAPKIAFTDSDCLPEVTWLELGLNALKSNDIVGGRMIVTVEDMNKLSPTEAFECVFAFNNKHYVQSKQFSVTANMFVHRSIFERVGGFINGVSEDLEWGRRAHYMGFSINYEDDVVVGHPARKTWKELISKWDRMNREAFALTKSSPKKRIFWIAKSLLMPMSVIIHTPKVFGSTQLRSAHDRIHAYGILIRLRLWRLWNGLKIATQNI